MLILQSSMYHNNEAKIDQNELENGESINYYDCKSNQVS